jgi:hypothetical protein
MVSPDVEMDFGLYVVGGKEVYKTILGDSR